jgi:hypothetical protein
VTSECNRLCSSRFARCTAAHLDMQAAHGVACAVLMPLHHYLEAAHKAASSTTAAHAWLLWVIYAHTWAQRFKPVPASMLVCADIVVAGQSPARAGDACGNQPVPTSAELHRHQPQTPQCDQGH